MDAPDETPTGRNMAIREIAERGENAAVRYLARQVESLVAQANERIGAEKERARSAVLWRWAGGIVLGIAVSMGGRALILAQDAAVDHQRLGTLEAQHRTHADQPMHFGTPAEIARLRGETMVTAATLTEVRDALAQLREEIRELRRETPGRHGR